MRGIKWLTLVNTRQINQRTMKFLVWLIAQRLYCCLKKRQPKKIVLLLYSSFLYIVLGDKRHHFAISKLNISWNTRSAFHSFYSSRVLMLVISYLNYLYDLFLVIHSSFARKKSRRRRGEGGIARRRPSEWCPVKRFVRSLAEDDAC